MFDDDWKEILPYPGFNLSKKAYDKITQWQEKEIRNLYRRISAVLASALRNPDSSQYHNFKIALMGVSTLVDFSHMAQYRSHIPDTLSHMKSYLQTFHQRKEIFLEFCTWKATSTRADHQYRRLRELIADQRPIEVHHRTIANRC